MAGHLQPSATAGGCHPHKFHHRSSLQGKQSGVSMYLEFTKLCSEQIWAIFHQAFQVPKMEVLSLIRLFWGWVFPYISLTYCLYR